MREKNGRCGSQEVCWLYDYQTAPKSHQSRFDAESIQKYMMQLVIQQISRLAQIWEISYACR
jgi:hypothetical protein